MIAERPTAHGAASERASPDEELAYRLRQQQISTGFALFALKAHGAEAILQEAAQLCADGLQSRMCKVMEYLPDEHSFVVRAGVGWKPGVVGNARVAADTESPAGFAFQTGEPVISNHLGDEDRFRTPDLLADHGVKRAINALITSGDSRYGVLEVDSSVEGKFTAADLVFVSGFANLIGVALDRQRTEAALMRNEVLLQRALAHQEVLAREISHRVKNSLSLVAALLSMQGRAAEDPDVRQALSDAQARVHAIAQVHDRLWRREGVSAVNLAEFLGELCDHLRLSAPGHELVCDVTSIVVTTDQAVSLGLLTNELVTNALKYAYPGGSGRVTLSVERVDADRLCLQVADSGVGLAGSAEVSPGGGLGRRIISSLSRQLGGRPQWQDAEPGTRFVLEFRTQTEANRD